MNLEDPDDKKMMMDLLDIQIQHQEAKNGLESSLNQASVVAMKHVKSIADFKMNSHTEEDLRKRERQVIEFISRSTKMIRRVSSIISAFNEQEVKYLESES